MVSYGLLRSVCLQAYRIRTQAVVAERRGQGVSWPPSVRGGGQCYISDPSPNNPWHVVTLILLCRTKAGWSHGEQLWSLRDVLLRFRSSVEEDIFLPKMHENAGFRPKIFIFFCGATADPWCGRGSDAVPHRPTSQRIRSDIPAFLRLHL